VFLDSPNFTDNIDRTTRLGTFVNIVNGFSAFSFLQLVTVLGFTNFLWSQFRHNRGRVVEHSLSVARAVTNLCLNLVLTLKCYTVVLCVYDILLYLEAVLFINLFRRSLMKKLTVPSAIKDHCYIFCMNLPRGAYLGCESKECPLTFKQLPILKRIKAFCKTCAPNFIVADCEGIIINTPESRAYGKCLLFGFRFGKNPNMKRIDSVKRIRDYQFKPQE